MESRRRVFVSDQEECPENAILREDQGSLFYVPGQVHDGTVGGPRGDVMDGIERSDELYKPFGPYDSMEDCISDNQDADDPGAYCAEIHNEITGEYPSQKEDREEKLDRTMTGKIYVASEEEAPDGVELKEDGDRLYYEKQQAYEHARALYADDVEDEIEDETDVEMPNADDAGDGTAPEEEFDQELEDLRSQIHDVEDETGPVSVE